MFYLKAETGYFSLRQTREEF